MLWIPTYKWDAARERCFLSGSGVLAHSSYSLLPHPAASTQGGLQSQKLSPELPGVVFVVESPWQDTSDFPAPQRVDFSKFHQHGTPMTSLSFSEPGHALSKKVWIPALGEGIHPWTLYLSLSGCFLAIPIFFIVIPTLCVILHSSNCIIISNYLYSTYKLFKLLCSFFLLTDTNSSKCNSGTETL